MQKAHGVIVVWFVLACDASGPPPPGPNSHIGAQDAATRAGATQVIDAATDGVARQDAASDASPSTFVGNLACYRRTSTATCSLPSQQCCYSSDEGGTCIGASETCAESPAHCDGPEDCAQGELCCVSNDGAFCQTELCDYMNSTFAFCHYDSDCPSALPRCCSLPNIYGSLCLLDGCVAPGT